MEGDHCTGHPKWWCWRSPREGRVGPLTILLSFSSLSPSLSLPLHPPSPCWQCLSLLPPFLPLNTNSKTQKTLTKTTNKHTQHKTHTHKPPSSHAGDDLVRFRPPHGGGPHLALPCLPPLFLSLFLFLSLSLSLFLWCLVSLAPAAVRSGGAAFLAVLPTARGTALLARGASSSTGDGTLAIRLHSHMLAVTRWVLSGGDLRCSGGALSAANARGSAPSGAWG